MSRFSLLNRICGAGLSFTPSSTLFKFRPGSFPLVGAAQKCSGSKNLKGLCRVNSRAYATTAKLNPPNKEADWVIVDVTTEDLSPTSLPPTFSEDIADDAKSLIRVLLRDASAELSLLLCSDAHMKFLNSMWRGVDSTTDVLSFEQSNGDDVVLGDVVISVDTARDQARENNYELRDEVRVLLVHGVLHLLGYDHEGKKEGDWLVVRRHDIPFLTFLLFAYTFTSQRTFVCC